MAGREHARQLKFTLTSYPGGGTCPQTLAERPFAPGYTAKSDSTKAGAYSPFQVHIARPDGQQELKVVNVTLPKGLTGKLAGIPYCSEAPSRPRAASSGKAEAASPSCPAASQIGTTTDRGRHRQRRRCKTRRQGVSSPVPTRVRRSRWQSITPAVAGPYRPRHRRRPGRAQRQPGNRPDQRGLRRDPERVRRGQAGHPLDRRQRRPRASSCSTRPTAPPGRRAARSTGAARTRPIRPRSAPTRSAPRTRRPNATSWLQAEAVHAACTGRPSGPRTRGSGRSWKHGKATPTSAVRR